MPSLHQLRRLGAPNAFYPHSFHVSSHSLGLLQAEGPLKELHGPFMANIDPGNWAKVSEP